MIHPSIDPSLVFILDSDFGRLINRSMGMASRPRRLITSSLAVVVAAVMAAAVLLQSGRADAAASAAVVLQSGRAHAAASDAGEEEEVDGGAFARTSGARFMVGGRPFYSNGFNAYWLMYMASDLADGSKAAAALEQASRLGAALVRTWAFSDGGGNRPLQISPGVYNEDMFMGLDFVIAEAKKRGIYLILSLVNNWDGFGGKKQYVQWARDHGRRRLSSDDDFFTDSVTKTFYKNHVKRVLTRVNKVTGMAYKDEPAIFAWELMNEPRCQSDLSGKTLQAWIAEMAGFVKSVDRNHMVEVGLEGFYGDSMPDRERFNPGYAVGADFISNNLVGAVDFATIHSYPDQWVSGASDEAQVEFTRRWMAAHMEDAAAVLRKPLLVTEFGWSARSSGYTVAARDSYFRVVYDAVYASARAGGPCAGGLFWQVMAPGMESWTDGYEVVLERSPSTAAVVSQECAKIAGFTPP